MRLILASQSPRRAELLRLAGFAFDVIVADVDERVRENEPPAAYVRRLAADKSAAATRRLAIATTKPGASPPQDPSLAGDEVVVLGADTAVVVDGEILGKPRHDEEAASMIRRLAGRWHEVMTGVSLRSGSCEVGRVETTRVEFAALSEAEIAAYTVSGEGRDKAGAYAIQGLASRFVRRIDGSYTNVVGLPVAAVAELLSAGLLPCIAP
jgi:septum formation protein